MIAYRKDGALGTWRFYAIIPYVMLWAALVHDQPRLCRIVPSLEKLRHEIGQDRTFSVLTCNQ